MSVNVCVCVCGEDILSDRIQCIRTQRVFKKSADKVCCVCVFVRGSSRLDGDNKPTRACVQAQMVIVPEGTIKVEIVVTAASDI